MSDQPSSTGQPSSPGEQEEFDEDGAEWDENDSQVRTIHIPFSEGVKLGFALAIGFLIAYAIIFLAVVLLFGTTLGSVLGGFGG